MARFSGLEIEPYIVLEGRILYNAFASPDFLWSDHGLPWSATTVRLSVSGKVLARCAHSRSAAFTRGYAASTFLASSAFGISRGLGLDTLKRAKAHAPMVAAPQAKAPSPSHEERPEKIPRKQFAP